MDTLPVIEETDIKLPKMCAGCGTRDNVKLFGFMTNAYSQTQRQIIPYCHRCTLLITKCFMQSWSPDVTALHDPYLYAIEAVEKQSLPIIPIVWGVDENGVPKD